MNQQVIQNSLAQLKDIKPIVAVHDISLYYLLSIVALVLLIVFYIAYKYFTRIKRSKKMTPKQIAFKKLKSLDFKDTKEVVYSFSIDGYFFINEKNKEQFKKIEKKLESFKYKKDVEELPQELTDEIKKFIKGVKNGK